MIDTTLPSDSGMPPLPWFLQEPSTHPEARPLALDAICLFSGRETNVINEGDLRIECWWATMPQVYIGLGVWWRGRVQLLADAAGTVLLYYPGAWETVLTQLADARGAALQYSSGERGAILRQLAEGGRSNVEGRST